MLAPPNVSLRNLTALKEGTMLCNFCLLCACCVLHPQAYRRTDTRKLWSCWGSTGAEPGLARHTACAAGTESRTCYNRSVSNNLSKAVPAFISKRM